MQVPCPSPLTNHLLIGVKFTCKEKKKKQKKCILNPVFCIAEHDFVVLIGRFLGNVKQAISQEKTLQFIAKTSSREHC